jgi:hypothetical protein
MNKLYKFDRVVDERWAVWYKEIKRSKNKLGVWRIIDLYSTGKNLKFAFRWKVKGDEKTQEQLDQQIVMGAIRNFYKVRGSRPLTFAQPATEE